MRWQSAMTTRPMEWKSTSRWYRDEGALSGGEHRPDDKHNCSSPSVLIIRKDIAHSLSPSPNRTAWDGENLPSLTLLCRCFEERKSSSIISILHSSPSPSCKSSFFLRSLRFLVDGEEKHFASIQGGQNDECASSSFWQLQESFHDA